MLQGIANGINFDISCLFADPFLFDDPLSMPHDHENGSFLAL
jgi:hypothetical protein